MSWAGRQFILWAVVIAVAYAWGSIRVHYAVKDHIAVERYNQLKNSLELTSRVLNDEREKNLKLDQQNRLFAERLESANAAEVAWRAELDELLQTPVNGNCTVDPNILNRLRNK